MEVIGQLTGGVAHDFNNILSVIFGYSEFMMQDLGPDHPLRESVAQIQLAAERGAGLAQQLLVFGRKEAVQPVILDLNEVLEKTETMLRQLIDEGIKLSVICGKQLGRIKADPGYVGQVLMNLVVNARDAMSGSGGILIATSEIALDENYVATHPSAVCGDYVMLSVSDTGTGMSQEIQAHLFEPFFTTKPRGIGTGLGLTTCQTIVKQSGGHIGLYSEEGKGTTFRIYFPRIIEPTDTASCPLHVGPLPRGTETIMVVEDDSNVRHLVCKVLRAQGYNVLAATNGENGLRSFCDHQGPAIRLVICDVIMPQMGGKAMAERLKAKSPDLKILFSSGYTDDAIARHGVLDPGTAFLSKPYSSATLARKVRELLDVPPIQALRSIP
jgi:CheY-like chemotaxis protein